jgi:CheY-like chemotaxis protein
VTASSFEEEQAIVLSAGCDDFLRKPFQETEVFDLLHKHLGVRFVYEENVEAGGSVPLPGAQVTGLVLTPEAFAALPEELRIELQQAVEEIDPETANSLIDRIREYNEPLAGALMKLLNQYRFDTLQKLFEERER